MTEQSDIYPEEKQILARKNPTIRKVLEAGYVDSRIFFKSTLPENFPKPFSSLHDQIIKMVDEAIYLIRDGARKIVICAPRGIGKTTIARGLATKKIVYCDSHFIPYVSKSATFAEMQTDNLRADLMESQSIRDVFGNIKMSKDRAVDELWSKKAWIANIDSHRTFILPRGSGQQIRGLLWRRHRPDGMIFDDLEDTETIDNDDIRKGRKEWFFADAMKVFETGNPNWWVVYIDTLKHEDSLMAELLELEGWESLRLSICDDNYKSLAPDFMSDKEIGDEVSEHRQLGLLDVFARERMSLTISKEDAAFTQDMWKYYEETDADFVAQKPQMESVLIVDPAKTAKAKSQETGFIVWGFNPILNRLYMRYAAQERLHSNEQIDRAFELSSTFNCLVIGIEHSGLGEHVTYPYETEARGRGLAVEIVRLTAKRGTGEFSGLHGGKRARVASMLPFYRRGQVYHNKIGIGAYELQLLGYPKSKKWHMMDPAGYITWLLDQGNRYFSSVDEMEEEMSDENQRQAERDFAELDKSIVMDDIGEEWMLV